jgi:hypothetical protein
MYRRLPDWMRGGGHEVVKNNEHEFVLENGSVARCFPTTAGDSYTATYALVDEADLAPDLGRLMGSVKPTIDHGGKLILLSRSNKAMPVSLFKRIYLEARAGRNAWTPIFLPWHAHPARTVEWYERQKQDSLANFGSLDHVTEQYPSTAEEALAPRSLDKRIPAAWLLNVYTEMDGTNPPGIPGLTVYRKPEAGKTYVVGADPAEGNPNSDDSAATVLDRVSGEECAVLAGKLQPSTFASYLAQIAQWYNGAGVLVERNNHGHAVLLWLRDQGHVMLLGGQDQKEGWATTSKSKALLYSEFTDAVRDEEIMIHSFETYVQLASVDGNTLSAPEGMMDDRAVSMALAWQATRSRDWWLA